MRSEKIPFADTHAFSPFFLDYIAQKNSLKPYYSRFPQLSSFKDQLAEKASFPDDRRKTLVSVLEQQYNGIKTSEGVKTNISSLASPKTFTVTTGHQLNLFTGPLYFIYKIVTVINACRQLQIEYPDYRFVPVYWMASEDHDFAEISYFNLFGKKYTWETNQRGAVGRFNPKELANLLKQIPGNNKIFLDAYLGQKTLSDAVRFYVNELFGNTGVVVIDADSRSLKKQFGGVIGDDLFNHTAFGLVDKSNVALNALGYKTQVNARPVNLFYLDDQWRSRLEADEAGVTVVDSPHHFTKDETEKLIEEAPEKFSPNVVLRPLYQEMILPNLAYVGGPAEIVYWLQLKEVFAHYKTPFPILLPRNCAMIMDAPTRRKFEKTGLPLNDLFEEKNLIFNHWVTKNANHDISLGRSIADMQVIFNRIKDQSEKVDVTLTPLVAAYRQQVLDRLGKIEKKLLKAEKRLHTDRLRQIGDIKDSLFPGGNLQERTDNFLTFFEHDPSFIQKLISSFDPFDLRFNVLSYDEG